jgi:uncharacterized protein (DUF433 family)
MDWTGSERVERISGKVSGRPLVRGTRVLTDTIVEDYEPGSPIEWIQENYPLISLAKIQQLLHLPGAHREQLTHPRKLAKARQRQVTGRRQSDEGVREPLTQPQTNPSGAEAY